MELKEVILESVSIIKQEGKVIVEEYVDYNLNTRIAEIEVTGGEDDFEEESESRFLNDIKKIVKLAEEAIPVLEDKIRNNKTVMLYSVGNEVEMDKAKGHLANNKNRLKVVKEFIVDNM